MDSVRNRYLFYLLKALFTKLNMLTSPAMEFLRRQHYATNTDRLGNRYVCVRQRGTTPNRLSLSFGPERAIVCGTYETSRRRTGHADDSEKLDSLKSCIAFETLSDRLFILYPISGVSFCPAVVSFLFVRRKILREFINDCNGTFAETCTWHPRRKYVEKYFSIFCFLPKIFLLLTRNVFASWTAPYNLQIKFHPTRALESPFQ